MFMVRRAMLHRINPKQLRQRASRCIQRIYPLFAQPMVRTAQTLRQPRAVRQQMHGKALAINPPNVWRRVCCCCPPRELPINYAQSTRTLPYETEPVTTAPTGRRVTTRGPVILPHPATLLVIRLLAYSHVITPPGPPAHSAGPLHRAEGAAKADMQGCKRRQDEKLVQGKHQQLPAYLTRWHLASYLSYECGHCVKAEPPLRSGTPLPCSGCGSTSTPAHTLGAAARAVPALLQSWASSTTETQ